MRRAGKDILNDNLLWVHCMDPSEADIADIWLG